MQASILVQLFDLSLLQDVRTLFKGRLFLLAIEKLVVTMSFHICPSYHSLRILRLIGPF